MSPATPARGHGDRLSELLRLPSLVLYAMRLVREAAPRLLLGTSVLQVVGGGVLAVQVLLSKRLLVDLLDARSGRHLAGAYPVIIGLTVSVAVSALAGVARFELQPLLGERVTRHSLTRVVEIASSVPLRELEDSEYHDRLQRALINAGLRTLQMTSGLSTLLGSLISVLAVSAALIYLQPLLFLVALVAGVPVLITTLRAGRALYRFTFDQTFTDRQRIYLQSLLTESRAAKDIRSYDLAPFLRERYETLYDRRIEALNAVVGARLRRSAMSVLLTALVSGGALALLVSLTDSGHLSLASAGAAGAALILLGNQLQGLAGGVGALYESSLYMGDFRSFVESARTVLIDGHAGDIAPKDFETISLEDVHFTYPNGPQPAIDGVSMTIPAGKVIALVGDNGSGKTTLAKLIGGLYAPDAGRICWDGQDAQGLSTESLRDAVALLFQDFSQFAVTAGENISWGRWQDSADEDLVMAAAEDAGATEFLGELRDGLDTQLGPEFLSGVALSGGQWQRLGMARALFRNAPLVILDEPTAAMDPHSEAALFAKMKTVFAGRTVIFVSHRMATVQTADYIYVLAKGRVIEAGTHRWLMQTKGRYSEMYSLQRDAYASRPRSTPPRPKKIST